MNPNEPTRAPRRRWIARMAGIAASAALLLQPALAWATCTRDPGAIRDAEIEALLRDYAAPILKVAGENARSVKIYILGDRTFNAFVADGRRMFFNAGALMQTDTPNELIGIIAHETGHIEGAHIARLTQEMSSMNTQSILAILIAIGAGAAASAGGGSAGEAGQAVMMGAQNAIMRQFLSARRAHESAADRAAVRYLKATGQSVQGMVKTFERFADQTLVSARYVDPYIQSHPMPRERLNFLAEAARSDPYKNREDPPQLQLRHDLMRAKLNGFLEHPNTVLRRYSRSNDSLPARYARAIARYCSQDLRASLRDIDGLIRAMPDYPYFWELKGQALLESGMARDAIAPLEKAVSLAPNQGLIRMMYGQALLATNDDRNLDAAIQQLSRAVDQEPEASVGLLQLAQAYGRKGDIARASMASARAYFVSGKYDLSKQQAARVKKLAKTGSPLWLQADDIINFRPPEKNR